MTEIEEDQIMYRHSCKGIRLQSYQSETLSTITTSQKALSVSLWNSKPIFK